MHCAEHRITLNAMDRLTRRYIKGGAHDDISRELESLKTGADEMIFRSQAFANEKYSAQVDEMIAASYGRAERLAGHTGRFAVSVEHPNGQKSGRMSNVDGNSTRLTVQDEEFIPGRADVVHYTSMFMCSRADDVAEVFSSMKAAEQAVQTMLNQGHEANPKGQDIQVRSMVYLRNLYDRGSLCASPASATHAAAASYPTMGVGTDAAFSDKLRSLANGLDMWARCGGSISMARRLYDDALKFFSKPRVWLPQPNGKRHFVTVRVPPEVVEAAPEHGGLGILPPGVCDYDYRIKCSPQARWQNVSDEWMAKLDQYVSQLSKNARGNGNLTVRAEEWFKRDEDHAPDQPERQGSVRHCGKAKVPQSVDEQSRFVERQATIARSLNTWHRD